MATKIEETLDLIKEMTVLELRDLNKLIEEEFGVTAAAPVAVAAAPAAAAGAPAEAVASVMAVGSGTSHRRAASYQMVNCSNGSGFRSCSSRAGRRSGGSGACVISSVISLPALFVRRFRY